MRRWLRSLGTWIKENVFLLLAAVGVGLLAGTERPFFFVHPHWQLFLKELAFACIISSIFALTIDKYQREEFTRLVNQEREDLKRDIFLYAYGHTVPDQIRNEIKERVLNCPFQRENLRIDWDFSPHPDKDDHVIVEKRQTYSLMNNTPQAQIFPFTFTQITASENESLVANEFLSLKLRRRGEDEITWNQGDMTHIQPISSFHPF